MYEEWRPIRDFEGCYEVSSLGRVRSLPGKNRKGKILKATIDQPNRSHRRNARYRVVNLHGSLRDRQVRVHVLVAETFHGDRPQGMVAMHVDEDSLNNLSTNIRWGTSQENTISSYASGKGNKK